MTQSDCRWIIRLSNRFSMESVGWYGHTVMGPGVTKKVDAARFYSKAEAEAHANSIMYKNHLVGATVEEISPIRVKAKRAKKGST